MSAISQYHATMYHKLGTEMSKLSGSSTFAAWLDRNPKARISPLVTVDGSVSLSVVHPVRECHNDGYINVFNSAQSLIEHVQNELTVGAL